MGLHGVRSTIAPGAAVTLLLAAGAVAQTAVHVQVGAAAPGDGSPASPYPTIQDGLAHPGLGPGDTVLVGAGTYAERFQIPNGVEVREVEGALRTTILAPAGGGSVFNGSFPTSGINASLKGFTVEGNGSSIGVETLFSQYLLVERCMFRGHDIAISSRFDLIVTNCTITDNRIGVAHGPGDGGFAFTFVDNTIATGNVIDVTNQNSSLNFLTSSIVGGDPQFFGAPLDLHLRASSPAIDAGFPGSLDPDGSPADLGALPFDRSWPTGRATCAGVPHSGGVIGRTSAGGSASLASSDLVLVADRIPAGQFALLVTGTEFAQVPLGPGTLCVGGAGLRSTPAFTGAGAVAFPGMPGALGAAPGTTLHFQVWFRDPGPEGFGLTSGVAVEFVP